MLPADVLTGGATAEQLLLTALRASPQIRQAYLSRMGGTLNTLQSKVAGKQPVNPDMIRSLVADATMLQDHLLAIVNANIDCRRVDDLFENAKDKEKFCKMLRKNGKAKCDVVDGKCTDLEEKQAAQVKQVEQVEKVLRDQHARFQKNYIAKMNAVLEHTIDSLQKNEAACTSACVALADQVRQEVTGMYNQIMVSFAQPVQNMLDLMTRLKEQELYDRIIQAKPAVEAAVAEYEQTISRGMSYLSDAQTKFDTELGGTLKK